MKLERLEDLKTEFATFEELLESISLGFEPMGSPIRSYVERYVVTGLMEHRPLDYTVLSGRQTLNKTSEDVVKIPFAITADQWQEIAKKNMEVRAQFNAAVFEWKRDTVFG